MNRTFLTCLIVGVVCVPLPISAEWVDEQQYGIFVFKSEFALRNTPAVVAGLGELQKDIEATLDLKCGEKLVYVHLFSNRWSYNQYVRREIPEGVGRPALFVAGIAFNRVFAYRHRDLETDLRHETTHALLHSALPYVPLWLDEGLAEYFESPANRRVEGSPHRNSLKWAIRFGWRPDLARLEGKTRLAELTGDDYRDAWGLIHFMLHGPPEARAALDEFLTAIPTGREPVPLSQSLRQRIPDLERQIIEHLR